MRRAIALTMTTGALLLSGCMVGPKYVRPVAPTAPAFEEASDWKEGDGWKLAQPDDAADKGKWWQFYGDPQLNALEDQIDSSNQTLKLAESNFQQARAAIRFNRASEAPTISVAPSIAAVRASQNQPYFSQSLANNGTGDFALPVDLAYEVDLWGRIRRSVDYAKEQAQASAADLETVRLSLHAELALDYWEVRSADAQANLLNDTVKAYSDALELAKDRAAGGAAPERDVAEAQTQLDTACVLASDIKLQRAQYEHAVAILIGKPPAGFHIPSSPLDIKRPNLPEAPVVMPAQLLERRPDIAEAERRMAAENEQIGIAKSAYFPTLGINAEAGLQGTSLLNWFNWPSRLWAVGPTLSETLFDAGRRRATTEAARASYNGTVANYRQTALNAYQQVEDNLIALKVLAQEVDQQQSATTSAEAALRLSENRYAGGVDTYLQVVIWQTSALQNERNGIDIMRRRLEASVLLFKALGGSWDTSKLPRL